MSVLFMHKRLLMLMQILATSNDNDFLNFLFVCNAPIIGFRIDININESLVHVESCCQQIFTFHQTKFMFFSINACLQTVSDHQPYLRKCSISKAPKSSIVLWNKLETSNPQHNSSMQCHWDDLAPVILYLCFHEYYLGYNIHTYIFSLNTI